EGAAFQQIFNPQEGAWVFKIGEGSALNVVSNINPYYAVGLVSTGAPSSASGVWFGNNDSTQRTISRVGFNDGGSFVGDVFDTFSATSGTTLGLRWQGDTITLFIDGDKFDTYSNPRLVAALAGATGMRVHRNLGIYFDHMS